MASKRGFTFLETMLSVALMLIVSLIVYEGFMTTLNYAGDTALAERVSNQNAGECYKTMGQETASLHAGSTSTAIMVSGTGYKGVFQVHAFSQEGGMSIFSSGSSFTDDTNFLNTTNRHGFVLRRNRTAVRVKGNGDGFCLRRLRRFISDRRLLVS